MTQPKLAAGTPGRRRGRPAGPTEPAGPYLSRLQVLVRADGRPVPEIAQAAGITPATLYKILSGAILHPSIEVAGQLVTAIGRKMSDLDSPIPPERIVR